MKRLTTVVLILGLLFGVSVSAETLLSVHFIDVGQGDAILIDYGESEILIDGGPNDAWVSYLGDHVDGSIELLIVTHPHADHIGGLPAVFSSYGIEEVWTNGATHTTSTFGRYWDAVTASGAQVVTVKCGHTSDELGMQLEVLHPCIVSGDLNNSSVVVRLRTYRRARSALTQAVATGIHFVAKSECF